MTVLRFKPPMVWVEIDGKAHIVKGQWRTHCGKHLDQSMLIMMRSMDGCMDCIEQFGLAHNETEPVVKDDPWDE
jgi:hypothetical protein